MRTAKKRSVISFQRSAGGPRLGEVVGNRLAARPHLWKSPLKAEKFMKISRLATITVNIMSRAQKMMVENKALINLAGGKVAKKKGGPKMKGYPVMLMKTKVRFSTASPRSHQVKQK